jgi:hypothetical protein
MVVWGAFGAMECDGKLEVQTGDDWGAMER